MILDNLYKTCFVNYFLFFIERALTESPMFPSLISVNRVRTFNATVDSISTGIPFSSQTRNRSGVQ